MQIITCKVNLFDYDQIVYRLDTETNETTILGRVSYDNLDHFITTMCNKENITEVRLSGLSAYAAPLKERIEAESVARYGQGVKVEIL